MISFLLIAMLSNIDGIPMPVENSPNFCEMRLASLVPATAEDHEAAKKHVVEGTKIFDEFKKMILAKQPIENNFLERVKTWNLKAVEYINKCGDDFSLSSGLLKMHERIAQITNYGGKIASAEGLITFLGDIRKTLERLKVKASDSEVSELRFKLSLLQQHYYLYRDVYETEIEGITRVVVNEVTGEFFKLSDSKTSKEPAQDPVPVASPAPALTPAVESAPLAGYLLTLKEGTDLDQFAEKLKAMGVTIDNILKTFDIFSVRMPASLVETVKALPEVLAVEENQELHIMK